MEHDFISRLQHLFETNKAFFLFGVSATVFGAIAGYIGYYLLQLHSVPFYLWILTADCPVAATFFLVHIFAKKKYNCLGFFSYSLLMAYGLLGIAVFVLHKPELYSHALSYLMLISHIGMIFLAMLLVKEKPKPVYFIPVYAWLIGNGLADYFFGTMSFVFFQTRLNLFQSLMIIIFAGAAAPLTYFALHKIKNKNRKNQASHTI